jgi:DNA mismatch repair protein MutS
LFATHYHELVALAEANQGIVAYHAASKQTDTGVLLLHKIIPGEAEGSFGIEVARRAQVPDSVVVRAQELMRQFNTHDSVIPARIEPLCHPEFSSGSKPARHSLPSPECVDKRRLGPIEKFVKTIDYDSVSPKQALDLLWKLKELV